VPAEGKPPYYRLGRMTDRHAFADAAGAILMKMAETRLTALLAEYGVADRRELPLSIQNEVLQRAVVGTAAANFPTANLEAVARGIESFAHPAFFPALERMWLATKGGSDAFAMTRGVYAAVVLAGFGLPVAPFDWRPAASSQSRVTILTLCRSGSRQTREPSSATTFALRHFMSSLPTAYVACGG